MKNKTAQPINVKPISGKDLVTKYADRVRHGKTAKDKVRKVESEK